MLALLQGHSHLQQQCEIELGGISGHMVVVAQCAQQNAATVHHRDTTVSLHGLACRVLGQPHILHGIGGGESAAAVAHVATIGGRVRHFRGPQLPRRFAVVVNDSSGLAIAEAKDADVAIVRFMEQMRQRRARTARTQYGLESIESDLGFLGVFQNTLLASACGGGPCQRRNKRRRTGKRVNG